MNFFFRMQKYIFPSEKPNTITFFKTNNSHATTFYQTKLSISAHFFQAN
jgi:hypothetical protein